VEYILGPLLCLGISIKQLHIFALPQRCHVVDYLILFACSMEIGACHHIECVCLCVWMHIKRVILLYAGASCTKEVGHALSTT